MGLRDVIRKVIPKKSSPSPNSTPAPTQSRVPVGPPTRSGDFYSGGSSSGSSGGGGSSGGSSGGNLQETVTVETLQPKKQPGVIVSDYAGGGSSRRTISPYQAQQLSDRSSYALSSEQKRIQEKVMTEELGPKKQPGVIVTDRTRGKSKTVYLDPATQRRLSKKDLKALRKSKSDEEMDKNNLADVGGNMGNRMVKRVHSGTDMGANRNSQGISLKSFIFSGNYGIRNLFSRTKERKEKEKTELVTVYDLDKGVAYLGESQKPKKIPTSLNNLREKAETSRKEGKYIKSQLQYTGAFFGKGAYNLGQIPKGIIQSIRSPKETIINVVTNPSGVPIKSRIRTAVKNDPEEAIVGTLRDQLILGAVFTGPSKITQARKITAVENEIKLLEYAEINSGSITAVPGKSSSRSLTILRGTQKTKNLNVEYYAELYGSKAGKEILQTGEGYGVLTGKVKYKNFFGITKEETLVGFSQFEAGAKPIVQIRRGKNVFFINKEVVTPKISNLVSVPKIRNYVLFKRNQGIQNALKELSKGVEGRGKSYVNIATGKQTQILTDPFEVYKSRTPRTKGTEVVIRDIKSINTFEIASQDTLNFVEGLKKAGKKRQNPFFSKPESKVLRPKSRPDDYSYLLPDDSTILKTPAKAKPENPLSLNSISNAIKDSLKLKPKKRLSPTGLAVVSAKQDPIKEIIASDFYGQGTYERTSGGSIPGETTQLKKISLTISEVTRSDVQRRRTSQRGRQKSRAIQNQFNDVLLGEILGEIPIQEERTKLAQRQRQRLNQRQIQRELTRAFSEPNLRFNPRPKTRIPKRVSTNIRKGKRRKNDEFDFDFLDDLAISQDFTAKVTGLKPKKIKRKDFYKEFEKQTGIGIRRGVLID